MQITVSIVPLKYLVTCIAGDGIAACVEPLIEELALEIVQAGLRIGEEIALEECGV